MVSAGGKIVAHMVGVVEAECRARPLSVFEQARNLDHQDILSWLGGPSSCDQEILP